MPTYWVKSGSGGSGDGSTWANAAESIAGLMTAQAIAGGDIIYVHNTHSFNAGAAITWTLPESGTGLVKVLCVDGGDATGASLVDGTVGSLTTGATETTGGNFVFTISTVNDDAALYVYGFSITAGAGTATGSSNITLSNVGGRVIFENCALWINSTVTSPLISIGTTGTTTGTKAVFIGCSFRFGNAAQKIAPRGPIEFINCSINGSGSSPTTLFIPSSAARTVMTVAGCDFSAATNVVDVSIASQTIALFNNCVIGTPTTGTHSGFNGGFHEFHACGPVDGTNGPDLLNYFADGPTGVVEDDQSVYLTTGGAQGKQDDGTATSYSFKLTPNANASFVTPLYTPWVYVYVGATGSKTFTMKCADTESAVLKNNELILEVEYVGGAQVANSPQSQHETTGPLVSGTIFSDATAAGSNLTDTGEAWTGITETGTYTLSKTVTVDEYGYVRCRAGLGKGTTNPVYVAPKIGVA